MLSKSFKHLVFIAMIFVLILSGCKKIETNTKAAPYTSQNPINETGLLNDMEVTLQSFGSFNDFSKILFKNYFGKTDINKDTKYSMSSALFAKMDIYGEPSMYPLRPYFVIYSSNSLLQPSDIDNLIAFKCNIYNDSDRDINMYFTFDYNTTDDITSTFTKTFISLKKGQLNEVYIPIYPTLLKEAYNMKSINQFYFMFDGRKDNSVIPAKLNIDKFVAVKGNSEELAANQIELKSDTNFFESPSNLSIFKTFNWGDANVLNLPSVSLNTDIKYITQGIASFKVVSNFTTNVNKAAIYAIEIPKECFSKLNLSDFDSNNGKLSIDVYNDTDIDIFVSAQIWAGVDATQVASKTLRKKTWTKLEVPLSEIKKVYELNEVTALRIIWPEPQDGFDYVFYFDNLSMEK